MQIIKSTEERVIIRMEANETIANAIRRSISEIQTLAIDEVEIFKNDSALYDEILAQRIGLIPLKTEKGMSQKTKIELKLMKKGPCTVYSKDLDGNADIIYGEIPLTILGKEHKLELVATASLGTGREHAKHLPGLCYYRHLLEVKSSLQTDKIIENSKFGLIKPEKKGSKWLCDLNSNEINEIESLDKESISDSNEILFVIESYGSMSAKDILTNSIKALENNLEDFEKAIK